MIHVSDLRDVCSDSIPHGWVDASCMDQRMIDFLIFIPKHFGNNRQSIIAPSGGISNPNTEDYVVLTTRNESRLGLSETSSAAWQNELRNTRNTIITIIC